MNKVSTKRKKRSAGLLTSIGVQSDHRYRYKFLQRTQTYVTQMFFKYQKNSHRSCAATKRQRGLSASVHSILLAHYIRTGHFIPLIDCRVVMSSPGSKDSQQLTDKADNWSAGSHRSINL